MRKEFRAKLNGDESRKGVSSGVHAAVRNAECPGDSQGARQVDDQRFIAFAQCHDGERCGSVGLDDPDFAFARQVT
jgi:hypothetical protein